MITMNEYRSIQCPAGSGGESDERLFFEVCICRKCKGEFDETEMVYSDLQFGIVCNGCFEQEQTEFK
jgi:hypothetical protein